MKIEVIPAGGDKGAAVTLISGVNQQEPLDDQELVWDGASEMAEFLRGPSAQGLDRENNYTLVTVSVLREFATFALAEAFMLSHAKTVPQGGTVLLTPTGGSNAFSVPFAIIKPIRFKQNGTSMIVTYTIRGGDLGDVTGP